ncbi:MAG: glycosyltransferase family 2 protein [Bacteroides sp.]|nr:glycosyltransferase family 2 protein [Bacteroides sp.]MCM1094714.1 glycosyltransferase family 2 protein [Terasakiella sp.]
MEFKKGLVSVVIPCYNVANYVSRQLESILGQDYTDIEVICIDDGSTDDTARVVKSYKEAIEKKFRRFAYSFQDNSGLAAVILKGISEASGQYFVWPDADDFYLAPDTISRMVASLESAPERVRIVRTHNAVFSAPDAEPYTIRGLGHAGIEDGRELFEDCLYTRNGFYFCAGAYMIERESFFKVSKMPFSTPRTGGQNWQLLLPMLYHYDCVTIPENMYGILEHPDSHGRANHGFEGNIARIDGYESTLTETLDNIIGIDEDAREHYKRDVIRKYSYARFVEAYNSRKPKAVRRYYRQFKNSGGISRSMALRSVVSTLRLSDLAYAISRFVRK